MHMLVKYKYFSFFFFGYLNWNGTETSGLLIFSMYYGSTYFMYCNIYKITYYKYVIDISTFDSVLKTTVYTH